MNAPFRAIRPPGEAASPVPPGATAFFHPEPPRRRARILPVFLPFLGCPGRCVYCAQPAATGTAPASLAEHLHALEATLDQARRSGAQPLELGFYGGTFTALPEPWPQRFLAVAARHRASGLVTRVRCSTRPDAVDPGLLARLGGPGTQGLDLIELGVQTFHGPALEASGRGYGPGEAHAACRAVRRAGLALGVQLLPGLPGHDPAHLEADVRAALEHEPEAVRLYPCVVLRGTPLAGALARGDYAPWPLEATVDALADALLALWARGVPAIRTGLAPEAGLGAHILAGPWHPALGQLARSLALFRHIRARAQALDRPPRTLVAPRRWRSDITGHQGALRPRYAALGLTLAFEDRPDFLLF